MFHMTRSHDKKNPLNADTRLLFFISLEKLQTKISSQVHQSVDPRIQNTQIKQNFTTNTHRAIKDQNKKQTSLSTNRDTLHTKQKNVY